MTAPRIGKKELARASPSTRAESQAFVLARALASPYGILIIFPGIVLCVGLFLALVGQRALKVSNVALGQRRLAEQASLVATHLRGALDSADPILDRLSDFTLTHAPDEPIEPAAAVMLDLMQGRAGVAFVSISFPDGTFQGTQIDTDGAVRFQDSRVSSAGTRVRRYDYRGHGALELWKEEASVYDPRKRDFYRAAEAARTRIWTKPYPFYRTHYTGITRAAPVYLQVGSERRLHAVLTVDFDVNALSRLMRAGELPDVRTLLFTRSGTLLAYPQAERRIAALPIRDRALSFADLQEPLLDSFFAALGSRPPGQSAPLSFDAGGAQQLAALAQVADDPELDWSVAYLVPESVFFESLHVYGRRSFGIAAVAVLLALGVSVAFARLVVRVRREAAEARAEAKRAHQEARELGSYRLVKRLGKGGMGEVWRAEHRLLAREAAIKLIRLDNGADATDAQERFRREAQTLAALRSRNTIELFDYGVADDGTFFYVMELLEGLDLESLVVRYGAQPPGRVLRLMVQACRSLAEAHDVGLVHRDIKPANLFVCRAADEVDLVKVLDFGLVRTLSDDAGSAPLSTQAVLDTTAAAGIDTGPNGKLTRAGSVMGTPEFMAPEQALGHEVDGRADLYALGCVAYWLLAGRLVFVKNTPMMLLIAHINEPPAPLERYCLAPVPLALKQCIAACLAKAPGDRPADARDLLRRLLQAEKELAPEEVWTEERAHAWWLKHQPPPQRVSTGPGLTPSPQGQLRIADVLAARPAER
ncbi:MAG: serine/threonine protein kinase [Myxococcales bacterium]|nr:MAG: serine/threonine protein kinase [Myxococcales bacterium]